MDAELWLNTGLSPELCAKEPELQKYGLYRRLDTGKYEFISYCTQVQDASGKPVNAAQGYTSINTKKLKSLLDDLLPAQQVVMP